MERGEAARRLDWPDLLLFGVDPHAPEQRIDSAGVCWLLDGRSVLAVTADRVAIRSGRGAVSYIYKHPSPAGVLLWSMGDS